MFRTRNIPGKHRCTTALYAFSGDPITYGHINVVERVSRTFDQVIVGIGRNPAKKYLFSLDARLRLSAQALSHLSNVTVQSFHGMVVDFASEQGAGVIVKGVRNAADFDYEQVHHLVGLSQKAGIDTHLLFADPALAHVSSSAVKAIQLEHGFIHDYVPLVVKAALEEVLSGQLLLGVTGVEGAGKSTLCEHLVAAGKARNVQVHNIDLDKLGHAILDGKDSPLHRETRTALIERFGRGIETEGRIDRKTLAGCVFGKPDMLADLNRIMVGPMTIGLRKALYGLRGVVLLNGALLAEAELLGLCNNRVILVGAASHEAHIARLKTRGYSGDEVKNRLAAQWTHERKRQAIETEIADDGFGRLWHWDTSAAPSLAQAARLLDEILEETGAHLSTESRAHAS
jgi:pantetheine-phosphate adenylyltransferase